MKPCDPLTHKLLRGHVMILLFLFPRIFSLESYNLVRTHICVHACVELPQCPLVDLVWFTRSWIHIYDPTLLFWSLSMWHSWFLCINFFWSTYFLRSIISRVTYTMYINYMITRMQRLKLVLASPWKKSSSLICASLSSLKTVGAVESDLFHIKARNACTVCMKNTSTTVGCITHKTYETYQNKVKPDNKSPSYIVTGYGLNKSGWIQLGSVHFWF